MNTHVSQKDIAKRLNMSRQIVGYALSNRPSVSEKTRELVLNMAKELGYTPNRYAQSLVTGRTGVVQIIVPEFSPYYNMALPFLTHSLAKNGYESAVFDFYSLEMTRKGPHHVSMPLPVEGIIIFDCPQLLASLRSSRFFAHTAAVVVGSHPLEGVDYVGADLKKAAKTAMRHLLGKGYRKIAMLFDVRESKESSPRVIAYCEAMRASGLEPEMIGSCDASMETSRKTVANYLKRNSCPEAFFCFNDTMALGCNRAIRKAALRVPQDVGLMGLDGLEELAFLECPISTMAVPITKMCSTAIQKLCDRIANPDLPSKHVVYPYKLVERESTPRPVKIRKNELN